MVPLDVIGVAADELQRIDAGEHLRLARKVVSDYLACAQEHRHLHDDLVSGAYLGLVLAAARHDGRCGTWGEYAYRYARGYMLIALRQTAYPTRPAHTADGFVTPIGVCVEDLEETLASPVARADMAALVAEDKREIDRLLSELCADDRRVIELLFGLGVSAETKSRAQIGREMGISEDAVLSIELRALEVMRSRSKSEGAWKSTS